MKTKTILLVFILGTLTLSAIYQNEKINMITKIMVEQNRMIVLYATIHGYEEG